MYHSIKLARFSFFLGLALVAPASAVAEQHPAPDLGSTHVSEQVSSNAPMQVQLAQTQTPHSNDQYLEPLPSPPTFEPNPGRHAPSVGDGWRSDTQPAYQPPGRYPNANAPAPVQSEPLGEVNRRVQSAPLAPVMVGDGSNLPNELWQGLTVTQVEKLVAELPIPPRSSAMHQLWVRAMTAAATPPQSDAQGSGQATPFVAVQSEALFRSGLLNEAHGVFATASVTTPSLIVEVLKARAAIAAEQPEIGCPIAKTLVRRLGELPKSLTRSASMMIGYCAVHDNNKQAAELAADFAEDVGVKRSPGVAALRAFALSTQPKLPKTAGIDVIEFRVIEKVGGRITRRHLEGAKPALLAAVAASATAPVDVRILAGETALRRNAILTTRMAELYRSAARASGGQGGPIQQAGGSNFGDEMRRAALFAAAETDQNPLRKARNIRAFLDSTRTAGLYWHGLRLMAEPAQRISTLQEVAWFAETGIEISLAAGDGASARRWAAFSTSLRREGGANLDHWQGLIDIADPGPARGRLTTGLSLTEAAAQRGLFSPVLLHRLATVLDALDRQVPIPLWELASRTPQPTTGHLPATGVLAAVQSAAKSRHVGHLILLTIKTLGPDGAEGAHMIALGDSIRALKRAGLEKEARQLGVEALFGSWPRTVTN